MFDESQSTTPSSLEPMTPSTPSGVELISDVFAKVPMELGPNEVSDVTLGNEETPETNQTTPASTPTRKKSYYKSRFIEHFDIEVKDMIVPNTNARNQEVIARTPSDDINNVLVDNPYADRMPHVVRQDVRPRPRMASSVYSSPEAGIDEVLQNGEPVAAAGKKSEQAEAKEDLKIYLFEDSLRTIPSTARDLQYQKSFNSITIYGDILAQRRELLPFNLSKANSSRQKQFRLLDSSTDSAKLNLVSICDDIGTVLGRFSHLESLRFIYHSDEDTPITREVSRFGKKKLMSIDDPEKPSFTVIHRKIFRAMFTNQTANLRNLSLSEISTGTIDFLLAADPSKAHPFINLTSLKLKFHDRDPYHGLPAGELDISKLPALLRLCPNLEILDLSLHVPLPSEKNRLLLFDKEYTHHLPAPTLPEIDTGIDLGLDVIFEADSKRNAEDKRSVYESIFEAFAGSVAPAGTNGNGNGDQAEGKKPLHMPKLRLLTLQDFTYEVEDFISFLKRHRFLEKVVCLGDEWKILSEVCRREMMNGIRYKVMEMRPMKTLKEGGSIRGSMSQRL